MNVVYENRSLEVGKEKIFRMKSDGPILLLDLHEERLLEEAP